MLRTSITLTSRACSHIQAIIQKRGVRGFRLAVKKDGCSGWSYIMDVVKEGRSNDIKIDGYAFPVYVDRESLSLLKGTKLDYVCLSMGQRQLVFNNPNVDQTCGCGESFSVRKSSGKAGDGE